LETEMRWIVWMCAAGWMMYVLGDDSFSLLDKVMWYAVSVWVMWFIVEDPTPHK
jgi:hypothetical protein